MADTRVEDVSNSGRRSVDDRADRGERDLGEPPRFDPARDREEMNRRAEAVATAVTGGETDVYEGGYDGREAAFEDGYRLGYEHGYTDGFLAGLDARPGLGDRFEFNPAGVTDASGRGASAALIAAVLGAVGYYGVVGIAAGTTDLGAALSTPFYLLAFAILFVLGLVRNLREGVAGLAFPTVFAGVFALSFTFAIEGVLVLVDEPSLAIYGAAGLAVLAVALVLAFVGYWVVLSAVEWDAQASARANAEEYARGRARGGSTRSR
jgi:hypothetical protein